jgi:hypothetical protein
MEFMEATTDLFSRRSTRKIGSAQDTNKLWHGIFSAPPEEIFG